ncbi:hypothetical protein Golob_008309 [Gossypium lobatum]|uniref:Strictosidine synthase conserved region domain-containing protein n=1 Tax=Gossypium lobatum TaxID=34289 RepID=A0A7J8MF25_9ROSI|nr:hypothetical protein [Gossypium lobatum]
MFILSIKFLIVAFFLSQNILQTCQQLPISKNFFQIELTQATGPESIAFDCKNEGPYVGVSDGRILKWQGSNLGWKEFAITSPNRDRKVCDGSTNPEFEPTCGRPLGLKFNSKTCDLYIADAYFGLLVAGRNGGKAQQLATSADGIPLKLTNALDIDTNTGMIYFTDSSKTFQRRQILFSAITFDRSGRLLKYDPRTKEVSVMYRGLAFPNGVALSKDHSFLLVAESIKMRILKFKVQDGGKGYVPEQLVQLSRIPDNIKSNEKGEFWVALNTGRESIQTDWLGFSIDPIGVKYDQDGKVLKQLDGDGGLTFNSVSEILEFNGKLYLGSVVKPYLGIFYA